ncbi:hydantoinase/oxoprolinase family protein [Desulforhopalus singaporensis]|uniref:N-methylhydantoinase A n=1 Tax=Desulforhopalus singaporensis TaxID=91360 RepID=A0A1H0VVX4_9BACT|nr:hydantoinase/oxoprolinase family protein [Desulforhopalus singaporensis]SDP82305.1 N-methylhydantoinase A [Desulforhopalus singaporensis]
MLKVGVDVGGTFTDTYATNGDQVFVGKSLTTPDNLANGVINAIEKSGVEIKDIDVLVHGSTIATNALITKNYYGWWPKTLFITTEGFRDALEIRRGRNQLYGEIDMYGQTPEVLIERKNRYTIREKVDADGTLVEAVSYDEVEKLIEIVKVEKPDSIAIVFINSYLNADNEIFVKKVLNEAFPGLPVIASVDVAPKFRELGRMVTVSVRALLSPIITDYMDKFENSFAAKDFKGEVAIIKGDGGTCNIDYIKRCPEMLIGSGPAAGVVAGELIGAELGYSNILTQDTGGTSYDVCVIENGSHLRTMDYEIDLDMPLIVPMTDVRSIGTGGGSIIWLDEGGGLRVGPQSAGAKPGPICYGMGGISPTVTDANLLLGRVDSTLGGKMDLDINKVKEIFKKEISDPLGRDIYEVAEGAINIACVNMARANSLITTSRGRDPRSYLPVLFGGAGGMHACKISEELGVKKALIIPNSGVASAMGATMMPSSTYSEMTLYTELANPDIDRLNNELNRLKNNVVDDLVNLGVEKQNIITHNEFHMRYVGQNYEIMIKDNNTKYDKFILNELKDKFNEAHLKERGINEPKFAVAIVDIRVMGASKQEKISLIEYPIAQTNEKDAIKNHRSVYFNGHFINTPIFDMNMLTNGHSIKGPAVIEMDNSCLVVSEKWTANFDQYKNIILEEV